MTWKAYEDTSQNEALINEFKGNLFEYLVASHLAKSFQIESRFITSFGGAIKEQLSAYESWLRKNDPVLTQKLPILAKQTALELQSSLPKEIDNVIVMGKSAGGSHNDSYKEADLVI